MDENKRYKLKIFTQIHSDDYDDCIEQSCDCSYEYDEGAVRIKYNDSENGFTVIKVYGGGIDIRRSGSCSIILRVGATYYTKYDTIYGSLPIECTARSVVNRLDENGGLLQYTADMVIGGGAQTNVVNISVSQDER